MKKPAVLLISPGILKWTDMDFGLPHLVSLGGYLQAHADVRVEILDLNYEGGDHQQLARTLDDLGPFLLIGLSAFSSFDYMRVMSLGRFLADKYPDVPLVTGGYHASALPKDLVFAGSPFDAVILGEGEKPLLGIVQGLLGGGRLEQEIYGPDAIQDLDELPPYQWQLLDRYWPRAHEIGRKFQVYLSRGCPYRCSFCMERAKSGYQWRAYSPERAIDELKRLSQRTDLSKWVVNLADPLFGLQRSWRRQVLEGIIENGLLPRQYWTLTRSDDLAEEDVELLARARFSIGIGVESGSPDMLRRMNKGNTPDNYLGALKRLARLSRKHGLNWAGNIIVGHPGETMQTLRESHSFFKELFTSAADTCGWLSIDPFRLYPGSQVHEQMPAYSAEYGTVFHHPEWWKSWYDGPFRAEHIDPSDSVDFEARVRFMYAEYAPLIRDILGRFRGQGRSIDRVFERSLREQADLMSPKSQDALLARARRAKQAPAAPKSLPVPIGLHVKNPRTRIREEAVRRLLEVGVLRTDRLIEALLVVDPDDYLGSDIADLMFRDEISWPSAETEAPTHVGFSTYAMGFEALGPSVGDRVLDLCATRGYASALLAVIVGETGEVVAAHPPDVLGSWRLRAQLGAVAPCTVAQCDSTTGAGLKGPFDAAWLGAALPRLPRELLGLLAPGHGVIATALGPRFRAQDLVSVTRRADDTPVERRIAKVKLPIIAGARGWLRPAASKPAPKLIDRVKALLG